MIPMITSSGTRSPRSYAALALRPSGVFAAMAARITSPVEILGMPRSAAIRSPCVPLPEPGGPSSTTIIGRSLEATLRAPAEPHAPLLHEAVVLPQQQVLLHLRERVERDAHHDQQRRSAEAEVHIDEAADPDRQQRDQREEDRARQRDPHDDVIDVIGRLRARLDARDEATLLLQVLREID